MNRTRSTTVRPDAQLLDAIERALSQISGPELWTDTEPALRRCFDFLMPGPARHPTPPEEGQP